MVKKENFPLNAGIISALIIMVIMYQGTRLSQVIPVPKYLAYALFILSLCLSAAGSFVGVSFVFRKDYRPKIIAGALLSGSVMGFQVFLVLGLLILSKYGV